MANDITGSPPWILDTVGDVTLKRFKLKSVYWLNPSTIGHTAILKDISGAIVWSGRCEVAAQSQYFLIERWFDSLKLDTLASGTLYVYYG